MQTYFFCVCPLGLKTNFAWLFFIPETMPRECGIVAWKSAGEMCLVYHGMLYNLENYLQIEGTLKIVFF